MSKELNQWVLNYLKTRSDDDFNEVYRYLIEKRRSYYEGVAKSLRVSIHDVIALYEDTLLKCIAFYDGKSDFERYFNHAIKLERAGLYKRQKRRMQHEWLESDLTFPEKGDFRKDCIPPFEMAIIKANKNNDNSAATEVLKKETEAEQRQLIDFLTQNMDAKTTAIVKAILEDDSPKYKPTAIGKKLGLHHTQVKRTIEKLAGHFDRQKYGSHRDYLLAR